MTEHTHAPQPTDKGPVLLEEFNRINGVLTLTLNRVEDPLTGRPLNNALNEELVDALTKQLERAKAYKKITMVVLKANGKTFCSGIDLAELAGKIEANDPAAFKNYARKYVNLFSLMDHIGDKPILGIIEGNAIGFGLTLVLQCDKALSKNGIQIAYPERKFVLMPWISAFYSMRRLETDVALKLMRSGEREGKSVPLDLKAVGISFEADTMAVDVLNFITGVAAHPIGYLHALTKGFENWFRKKTIPPHTMPANPDAYDHMAQEIITHYQTGSEEERNNWLAEKFTQEICTPKIATSIRSYLKQLEEAAAAKKLGTATLIPQPKPVDTGENPSQFRRRSTDRPVDPESREPIKSILPSPKSEDGSATPHTDAVTREKNKPSLGGGASLA